MLPNYSLFVDNKRSVGNILEPAIYSTPCFVLAVNHLTIFNPSLLLAQAITLYSLLAMIKELLLIWLSEEYHLIWRRLSEWDKRRERPSLP